MAKGQIISEQICGVLKVFQKKQRNIARISALVSKMGEIKKKFGRNPKCDRD